MSFRDFYRRCNEKLMLKQGWVPERALHELDARADRLIALYEAQPVTTEHDVLMLAGRMNQIIERNVAKSRKLPP